MTTPAQPADLPADVIAAFDALCAAARIEGKLGVVRAVTDHFPYEHFIVGVRIEGGLIPIGIIPTGKNVIEFLGDFDYLMSKARIAEMDPEYKGVKM